MSALVRRPFNLVLLQLFNSYSISRTRLEVIAKKLEKIYVNRMHTAVYSNVYTFCRIIELLGEKDIFFIEVSKLQIYKSEVKDFHREIYLPWMTRLSS